MQLDSARNAKAEIFRQALGYVEEIGPYSAGAIPVFLPEGAGASFEGMAVQTALDDPRSNVAIGIAPPRTLEGRRAGRDGYEIVMLAQEQDRQTSQIAERAQDIARGEIRMIYTGHVYAQSFWTPARRRPLQPGISAGHFGITAGTLGCFLERDGELCMLSNNHVFANVNGGAAGDDILQQGRFDGGRQPADVAGSLLDFEPIAFGSGTVNVMDAAISEIANDINIIADYPTGSGAPAIVGVSEDPVDIDDQVFKVGRTTGYTTGSVFAIEVDQLIVNMGSRTAPRRARFDGQFQVYSQTDHFSRGGDSGSLVVNSEGLAVGLLFAGSDTGAPSGFGLTSINPIGPILDRFDARVWTG